MYKRQFGNISMTDRIKVTHGLVETSMILNGLQAPQNLVTVKATKRLSLATLILMMLLALNAMLLPTSALVLICRNLQPIHFSYLNLNMMTQQPFMPTDQKSFAQRIFQQMPVMILTQPQVPRMNVFTMNIRSQALALWMGPIRSP